MSLIHAIHVHIIPFVPSANIGSGNIGSGNVGSDNNVASSLK